MFAKLCCAAAVLMAVTFDAYSAEPDVAPLPASITALSGCWEGSGDVMGKPVAIAINAYPIVQNAMLAVEAVSSAIADPEDLHSAHLLFGGAGKHPGTKADDITGYWADSFGGALAAPGRGMSATDGFDITYQYSDAAFVNRWRITGDRLTWKIVARDGKGIEKPFANYILDRSACQS